MGSGLRGWAGRGAPPIERSKSFMTPITIINSGHVRLKLMMPA
jgi:hypothetical protein